jgi:hypothetical protein
MYKQPNFSLDTSNPASPKMLLAKTPAAIRSGKVTGIGSPMLKTKSMNRSGSTKIEATQVPAKIYSKEPRKPISIYTQQPKKPTYDKTLKQKAAINSIDRGKAFVDSRNFLIESKSPSPYYQFTGLSRPRKFQLPSKSKSISGEESGLVMVTIDKSGSRFVTCESE